MFKFIWLIIFSLYGFISGPSFASDINANDFINKSPVSVHTTIYDKIKHQAKAPFPHSIVYRVDSRDIEAIRDDLGFSPRESNIYDANNNLASHISGNSIVDSESPFVSTTVSWQMVIDHSIRNYYRESEDQGFFAGHLPDTYIYAIRPTDTFYDAMYSLNIAISESEEPDTSYLRLLAHTYQHEEEITHHGTIDFNRIMSHAVITVDMLNERLEANRDENGRLPSQIPYTDAIYSQMFWAQRWIDNSDYDEFFDDDRSSTYPWREVSGESATPMLAALLNGTSISVGLSCHGLGTSILSDLYAKGYRNKSNLKCEDQIYNAENQFSNSGRNK